MNVQTSQELLRHREYAGVSMAQGDAGVRTATQRSTSWHTTDPSGQAERALWQNVLLSVVVDLCAQGGRHKDARITAQRWIGDFPSRDFRLVCFLAGFEPEAVWPVLHRLAQLPVEKRKRKGGILTQRFLTGVPATTREVV